MPASKISGGEQELPDCQVSIPLLMLFQVAALIIRSFVQNEMTDAGYETAVARHTSALIGFATLGLFLLPILGQAWPFARGQFQRPRSWGRMILASAALGFILWLGQVLALLILAPFQWIEDGPYGHSSSPEYLLSCQGTLILVLAIPVMSLLTPVIEEVINRGLILQRLLPRGNVYAVIASAALFAVLHEFSGMPNAFVFGIFAALQMLHYRTLWAVIITHGTANLLVALDHVCLEAYWLPGDIVTGFWSPAPLIPISFLACLGVAWWLASRVDAGAVTENNRPG